MKATIRTYYNASSDGIADKKKSPYITEMQTSILDGQNAYLAQNADARRKPAIVLDADDTTLWTYDMEDGAMHFNFDPTLQNTGSRSSGSRRRPAWSTSSTQAAKRWATRSSGITGRNDDQEAATLANLDQGRLRTSSTRDNFYTKWTGSRRQHQPSYITCAATQCTTVEYKAGTRKHIEQDLGYDIVLNVGDQWSDLQGGYADQVLKLPNPTYYLPSPDLAALPPSRPSSPRTEFTMAAGRLERRRPRAARASRTSTR